MKRINQINKGVVLEELMRAFFLRAGFFVVRGVPYRYKDEDLTDIDLWMYERPNGCTRRLQICDIKYKRRPKAVERMFWTHGVAAALGVDSAHVVTTDKRPYLRSIARTLNIHLIDGNDVNRIKASRNIGLSNRLHDEALNAEVRAVDFDLKGQDLQTERKNLLSSLTVGFGTKSIVTALGSFARLAKFSVNSHPDSRTARASGRLAYLAAAIACASLDYLSREAAFGTSNQKRDLITDAVRKGILNEDTGKLALDLAMNLIEQFVPAGASVSLGIEARLTDELSKIPAEIISDQAVVLVESNELFKTSCEFEMSCYAKELPTFDRLSRPCKSMLGSLLDFGEIPRRDFALAWNTIDREDVSEPTSPKDNFTQQTLFGDD